MSYDAWKTRSDLDDEDRLISRRKRGTYCDLCDDPEGEATCAWVYGLETWACAKCRDATRELEDE